MIELDFTIHHASEYSISSWRELSDVQLRYDCFLGDVRFVSSGVNFSTVWGWIPIFDFALSFRLIGEALVREGSAVFEFTDSDHVIEFNVQDERVVVRTNYAIGQGVVELSEFSHATAEFLSRVRTRIEGEFPDLRENVHYRTALGQFW